MKGIVFPLTPSFSNLSLKVPRFPYLPGLCFFFSFFGTGGGEVNAKADPRILGPLAEVSTPDLIGRHCQVNHLMTEKLCCLWGAWGWASGLLGHAPLW